MKKLRTVLKHAAGTALAATLVVTPAIGQAVDFAGKKVTVIVPFNEGGGADVYARLMQPFLQKYLPGQPTVIVRNEPGGGGIKSANKFQKVKGDGLTALTLSTSNLIPFALGQSKVKYDILSWRPVILSPQGSVFYASSDVGVMGKDVAADVATLRKTELTFGAKNPTSSELRAVLAYELMSIKNVNVVFGLSSGKQRKAVMRGELNINYDSANAYWTKVSKFEEKGTVKSFMTMGVADADGNVIRDPAAPNLPTWMEAYEATHGGKKPTGVVADAFMNFLHMGVSASKSMVLPKGTPDDVRDAWVGAIEKTMQDPDFKKLAKKAIGVYPQYMGDDAAAVLKAATDMKPATREYVKKFIKQRFGTDI